jgi:hypothetical protein
MNAGGTEPGEPCNQDRSELNPWDAVIFLGILLAFLAEFAAVIL